MSKWLNQHVEETILIHQGDNHNKFWTIRWDNTTKTIHTRWGRIGTAGGSKETPADVHTAPAIISRKQHQKMAEGYRKIKSSDFDKLTIQAAIVGSQNKCHDLQWVEISSDGEHISWHVISEDRLYDPNCNPGLLLKLETRKCGGETSFQLLFSVEKCYKVSDDSLFPITEGHALYSITKKIEEAISVKL